MRAGRRGISSLLKTTSDVSLHGSGGEAARVARLRGRERAAALGRVDAPTRDVVGYNLPSTFEEEMPRTSVHVVQVLVPLAVEVASWYA